MGRLLQAAVLVMGMVGIAGAVPTRKVKVETTPPGASVYIDDVSNGAACDATPCTIDAPIGEPTLIIQLAGYEPELMGIDVPKGKKAIPTVSVKLKGAIGTIRIVDAPKGATVKINNEAKGKVGSGPLEIEVPAEPASVVITYNGKSQTALVDVTGGQSVDVPYEGASGTATTTVADTDEAGGDAEAGGGSDDEPSGGEIKDTAEVPDETPAAPDSPRFLEAGLVMDIGFRQFTYTDGTNPFNNSGEVLLGPAVELWPGRMLGVKALRGLSLFGRFQFSVSHQQVTREVMGTVSDVGAATFYGALEVSLRQKFVLGSIGLELSGGYIRDQVEFSADNATVLDMVPSADYKSVRLGGRISYIAAFEPYVSAENRFVLDGGDLGTRADSAETSGFGVAAGVRTKLGPVGVRAQFAYSKYTWTFSGSGSTPPGATDTLMWLSFLAGYDY